MPPALRDRSLMSSLEDLRQRLLAKETKLMYLILSGEASLHDREAYLQTFGSLKELDRLQQRRQASASLGPLPLAEAVGS